MQQTKPTLRDNLTMLTDFYEITMANGYFENGFQNTIAYFDMFFRRVPDGGGFALLAGVQQLVEYLENLTFTEEDIAYLRSRGMFSEAFLSYLADFQFSCDVWPSPRGRLCSPASRWSRCAVRSSRPSLSKPWCS